MDVVISIARVKKLAELLAKELPEKGRSAFENKVLRLKPTDVVTGLSDLVQSFNHVIAYSDGVTAVTITEDQFNLINEVLDDKSLFKRS